MRLSIVVPSLNQGEFIGQTLLSLSRQRKIARHELEIIVMDGGSADDTAETVQRFAACIDHFESGPDHGQTDALKRGFERCTGEILGWLCADDLLAPDAAREVLDYFEAHPDVSFVYGDAMWIDRRGHALRTKREIPFNWFIWLNDHNYIPQPAAFWRRELYHAAGGLDEHFDLSMDAELFARFACLVRPRHVRRIWAAIRSYPDQKTKRLRSRGAREDARIRQGFAPTTKAPARLRRLCARSLRIAWKLAIGGYLPAMFAGRPHSKLGAPMR